jgi:hypothetical protein
MGIGESVGEGKKGGKPEIGNLKPERKSGKRKLGADAGFTMRDGDGMKSNGQRLKAEGNGSRGRSPHHLA